MPNRQGGNVLFLILIAVALFAALSYAVTQSTRSGAGSTEREQSLLGSASLTQYPSALKSTVMRMILGGVQIDQLAFNGPTTFSALSSATHRLVFHPEGGGAAYQQAPGTLMVAGVSTDWTHNAQLSVPQIGTDGTGGNDVIAFLRGVNEPTCARLNEEFGFGDADSGECGLYQGNVPQLELTDSNITTNMTDAYSFPSSPAQVLQCASGTGAFVGRPSGCFYDTSLGQFVFYSVLVER